MSRVELHILSVGNATGAPSGGLRCTVNKWKFQDKMMGEQFVSFNVTSEKPIDWSVGDYCIFRGETYTLNYVPTVTQKSRTGERQDAYTYENVKFESRYEELTRCTMLDIIPTSDMHQAILGTNYTGSSKFQLFCGETLYNGRTYTAVCALALKMQANLDRMYGAGVWTIDVDTTTSYTKASGVTQLMTHTDDKTLTFDNTTVAKALEEVHNIFKLDYCVKGRLIQIGHTLRNLTSDNDNEAFAFGYGKGYPTREDMGTGLFKLKRVANSQQKIVTRLRAMGSTKNMPYRYYNGKYGLSQSLFPTNLQLPNTFENPSKKSEANGRRDELYGVNEHNNLPYVRHVKGETNDSYIEKEDNAEGCAEGLREDSARWDGSNSDLPEIYPTIEEVTFGDLRGDGVLDQAGGNFEGYGDNEHIDELLAVGYKNGSAMIDDANVGNGILTENGEILVGNKTTCLLEETRVGYDEFMQTDNGYAGPEKNVFIINDVYPGKYTLTPALSTTYWGASIYNWLRDGYSRSLLNGICLVFTIKQRSKDTGVVTTLCSFRESRWITLKDGDMIYTDEDWNVIGKEKIYVEREMPSLPGVAGEKFAVTEFSDIILTVTPYVRNIQNGGIDMTDMQLAYWIGKSKKATSDVTPEYHLVSADSNESDNGSTFHVFIKDIGFDITACFTGEEPVMAMKSGRCVGREFTICQDVEKITYDGKRGYMLTLKRKEDTGLNTYYPSYTDRIETGDKFVLLNINMPDAYIEAAEMRLLRAATDYLSDNSETKFTYQPSIDDIYLQRNLDICRKENRESDSVFWRLYAGLKFTFIARFASGDDDIGDELVSAELTIEQVTIEMGDGLTPKVEIRLNDDVQQSTLQKLTTSIDRIYSGSIFGGGGSGGGGASTAQLISLIQSEGEKQFLSKRHDDMARGVIGFLSGLWVQAKGLFGIDEEGHITGSSLKATGASGNTVADTDGSTQKNLGLEVSESGIIGGILRVAKSILTKTIQSTNFTGGDSFFGTGWQLTDNDGNGNSRLVVDNLFVRMKAVFNELEVRKFVAMAGNYIFSPAASIIEEVDYIVQNRDIETGEIIGEEVLGYTYVKVPWVLRLVPLSLLGKILSKKKLVRTTVNASDLSQVNVFRCWLRSDDGTTRTINTWQVGMLARCQTFNMASGREAGHAGTWNDEESGKSVTNKLYWRAVTGVGEAKTKDNYSLDNHILEDGLSHNYIDLSNDDGMFLSGSDNPEAFDHVVCYGDWKDRSLSNLISIETVGSEAPCIREMLEVGYTNGQSIDWSLNGKERTRISPVAGNKFVAPSFIVTTDNGMTGEALYNESIKGVALRYDNTQGQTTTMATDGSIVLLVYSNIETDSALKICHVEQPHLNPITGQPTGGGIRWTSHKANLGDAYINQQDGHRYVATATGWEDRGLSDESKSTLKVDITGITERVSSLETAAGTMAAEISLKAGTADITTLRNDIEQAGVHVNGNTKEIELIADKTKFSKPGENGGNPVPMIAVQMCNENGEVDPNGLIPSIVFYDDAIGSGGEARFTLNYLGLLSLVNSSVAQSWESYTLEWLGQHSVAVGMDRYQIIHAEAFCSLQRYNNQPYDSNLIDTQNDVDNTKDSGTAYWYKSAYHTNQNDEKVYDPRNGKYKENRFWDSNTVSPVSFLPSANNMDADGFYIVTKTYHDANPDVFRTIDEILEDDEDFVTDPSLHESGQSHVSPVQLSVQERITEGMLSPAVVAQVGYTPIGGGGNTPQQLDWHDIDYILLEVKDGYIYNKYSFTVRFETVGTEFLLLELENGDYVRVSRIYAPSRSNSEIDGLYMDIDTIIYANELAEAHSQQE